MCVCTPVVQRESLGIYSSRGCVENRCVSTPARKGPTWSHVPWTAGQGLFCFFSVRTCSTICRFGYRQTEMKHNKFKTNKLTTAASQDQTKTTTRARVLQLAPFGYCIQGQTEMKHTKFKTNKLTTAACTKHSRKRQDFKKGFLVGWL